MDELYENQEAEDVGGAGQEEVVAPQEEHGEAGAGNVGESGNEPDNAGQETHAGQTREDNAAARAARVRAEQETAQRLQTEYDGKIAGMGVVNPYTGKPFRNFKEFEEYGEKFRHEKLEEEAKRQGRSVEELTEEQENRSYVTQKRREEQTRQEAVEQLEQRKQFMLADLQVFRDKHPDIDIGKLEQNAKFRRFAGKRLYQEPLSELYGDFVEIVSDAEHAAVEKAAGKQARSTGGSSGGGGELLSPQQQEELEEWNRENPHLKMTGKEFLGRG